MTFSIAKIDHIVITSSKPQEMIGFYSKLGFKVIKHAEFFEFCSGDFMIKMHFLGAELEPHASNVRVGSADFCLIIEGDLDDLRNELARQDLNILTSIVLRNGAKGPMKSIYLYDPDGNLVELSSYL